MQRGQSEPDEKKKQKQKQNVAAGKKSTKRGKAAAAAANWSIPDDLLQFLVNLPRSVQAGRPKGIPWVLKRLWKLLDCKADADAEDNRLG